MYPCSNGVQIIEDESELPQLSGHTLYMDFETTSGDPKLDSINPWFNCKLAGICVAVDNSPVYYIPVGHHAGRNINAKEWLADLLQRIPMWVNHNIKYDAHALENDYGLRYHGRMADTVVLAKLYQSDLFSYSLKNLMDLWLPEFPKVAEVLAPYLIDNKDYGRIPIDILGFYGGQDVICNRHLYRFLTDLMPTECRGLMETEIDVTAILYDIECLGMRTEPKMLRAMNVYYIEEMIRIEKQLLEMTGYNIRPHVNDDCYDLLCNGYGLPVLKWTNEEETNPSFSKDVLWAYLTEPGAPVEAVKLLLKYREMNTFRSLFLETYLRLNVNGVLHPDINQVVNTGRMAVRRPNSQQLNKNAKKLILPEPGCSFLSIDYSQIEFRLIVHYTQNTVAIKAYNDNPDTDFHQWVADMVRINRRPAKTVNFCMGYGGGKKKLISLLVKEPSLVEELIGDPEAMLARAEYVYETYHKAMPTLKSTSRAAEQRARARGYVFNLFGRRRHLDRKRSHIAFNALNQSTAADIMKERLVPAWEICKHRGIRIGALVHDEFVFHGPTDVLNESVGELIECLEQPAVKLSIPIRCTYGLSDKSWYHAGLDELKWPLERSPWHAPTV